MEVKKRSLASVLQRSSSLARSSSTPRSASARCRRALPMATAACPASVSARRMSRAPGTKGRRYPITSAPNVSPKRESGTPTPASIPSAAWKGSPAASPRSSTTGFPASATRRAKGSSAPAPWARSPTEAIVLTAPSLAVLTVT